MNNEMNPEIVRVRHIKKATAEELSTELDHSLERDSFIYFRLSKL